MSQEPERVARIEHEVLKAEFLDIAFEYASHLEEIRTTLEVKHLRQFMLLRERLVVSYRLLLSGGGPHAKHNRY